MKFNLNKMKYKIQYYDLKYPYIKYLLLLFLLSIWLFRNKVIDTIILILVFTISIVMHEVSHGLSALYFGDDSAKLAGRITLNPLKHFDLEGIILPVILLLLRSPIIIGSAKPVPINSNKFKNYKLAMIVVSLSGIFANILLAILSVILLKFFYNYEYISKFLINLFIINVSLAAFNIIPIPPLDGSRILNLFASYKIKVFLNKIESNPFISFLLIMIILNTGLFQYIYTFIYRILLWI